MKKLLLPLLLLISVSAYSQTPSLPLLNGKIIYTEVIPIEGKNQGELHILAREWFAKSYNSANNVIQMDDKESGKIIGKPLMGVYHKGFGQDHPSGDIHYTISINTKDGRYKYEVTEFYHTGNGVGVPAMGACENLINPKKKRFVKTFDYYLLQMDTNVNSLIASLKTAMASETTTTTNEDW